MKLSTRSLFLCAAGVLGLVSTAMSATRKQTPPVTLHTMLEVDGVQVGWITNKQPTTSATASLVHAGTSDIVGLHHTGVVKYTDFQFTCGAELGQPFFSWVNAQLAGSSAVHSCTLIEVDSTNRATTQVEFTGAVINEVTLPALSTGSTQAGYLTFSISPRTISSASQKSALVLTAAAPRAWSDSNFKFNIEDIGGSTVTGVSPIRFRGKVVVENTDSLASPSGSVAYPTFTVDILPSELRSFVNWFDALRRTTNPTQAPFKSGEIDLLDIKGIKVCTLTLKGVGATQVVTLPTGSHDPTSGTVTLFMQQLTLTP